jgi:hypothetical protein
MNLANETHAVLLEERNKLRIAISQRYRFNRFIAVSSSVCKESVPAVLIIPPLKAKRERVRV